MNIPKHAEQFRQEIARRNFRPNTVNTYTSNVKYFLAHFAPREHPKHISSAEVAAYLGRVREPNTQRSYHAAIKLFYEICCHQRQKFKYIPYAKKATHLPQVLSVDEVQRLFNVCANTKHRVILALLYATGMRVSELINLRWTHIDRSRGVINILNAKGGKDRQVPLAPAVLPLLEQYYRTHGRPAPYVLAGQFTTQYSETSVNQVLKQLAAKAGIKKRIYAHLMRHNAFTHMMERGTDINLIQRLAGHANVKTTAVYLHTSAHHISGIQTPLDSIAINARC